MVGNDFVRAVELASQWHEGEDLTAGCRTQPVSGALFKWI
jgi:hypothetical protein